MVYTCVMFDGSQHQHISQGERNQRRMPSTSRRVDVIARATPVHSTPSRGIIHERLRSGGANLREEKKKKKKRNPAHARGLEANLNSSYPGPSRFFRGGSCPRRRYHRREQTPRECHEERASAAKKVPRHSDSFLSARPFCQPRFFRPDVRVTRSQRKEKPVGSRDAAAAATTGRRR